MERPILYLHSSPTNQKQIVKSAAMAAIGNVTKSSPQTPTSISALTPIPMSMTIPLPLPLSLSLPIPMAIQPPPISKIDDVVVNSIIYAKPSFCSIVANISSSSSKAKKNNDGSDVNLISSIVKGNTIPCLSKLIADLLFNTTNKQDAQLYRISTTINGSINHHISNICENLLAFSLLKSDSDSSSEDDNHDDDDDETCDSSTDNDDNEDCEDDSDDSLIEFASEAEEDKLIGVHDMKMYATVIQKPLDCTNTNIRTKIAHKFGDVYSHDNGSRSCSHIGVDVVDFIKVSGIISTNHIICQTALKKKVRFNTNNSVHVMRTWDFAYRAARRGQWETYARDRERFKMRIQRAAVYLNPILSPEHRERIRQQRFITLCDTVATSTTSITGTATVAIPTAKAIPAAIALPRAVALPTVVALPTAVALSTTVALPIDKVNVKLVCKSKLDCNNYSKLQPKLSKLIEIESVNYATNQRANSLSKKCKMRRKATALLYYSNIF